MPLVGRGRARFSLFVPVVWHRTPFCDKMGPEEILMSHKAIREPEGHSRALPDGLAITIERLNMLLADEGEDDFLSPGEYALTTACALLKGAGAQMEAAFPAGSPSADGAGGVRIEWQRSGKEVRLVVPAKPGGTAYIYHEVGAEYAAAPSVSAETLAFWLNWLVTA